MKIAVLGGTFNPLHIGHCLLAESVVKELGYDKVIFVPSFIPPHKAENKSCSAEDRLNMVKAFCNSSDCFEAESCEIDRGGVSYTFDTLEYICRKYNGKLDEKPGLIMGQEVAAEFDKWYRAFDVAAMSRLILARRHADNNGIDVSGFQNASSGDYNGKFVSDDFEKDFRYDHVMLENPVLPVSSTEIRARIALGKSWQYLVPPEVFMYIKNNNLYLK